MKKKNIIITIVILLPILIFWLGGFRFDKYHIIERNVPFKKAKVIIFWKDYEGGRCITGVDFFDLQKDYVQATCRNERYKIKKDTLYFAEQPIAKIVSLVHRCFLNDYILTIQSLDGQKTGSYISK